ncbi:hypothetical protein JOF56_006286 [Kibdelosporangium banguiense]|uniref:MFS transporter n=1 Tax=Kibdelosporangium banguiense TaxID=1365924 RepID=A0ABS4TPR1_9PSEU|nr:hypothetical protein [Kibdelosporangium banguiense]MBP2325901.1 hypothetical protein [Kibdelosporangium banguiense]
MTDLAVASRISRTVLPGAAMIAVTFGLARYGYGLLLPDMQSELGMGASAAGLISSGAYVSYALAVETHTTAEVVEVSMSWEQSGS